MKKYYTLLMILTTLISAAQDTNLSKIYRTTEVDQKPNLQDGMYRFSMFISENFTFPEIKNKQVKIFTSFIIEPDGKMHDVKAFYISVKDYLPENLVKIQTEEEKLKEKKIYETMKAEAARVVSLFDQTWTPAIVNGQPVRCLYNYPITFNIE